MSAKTGRLRYASVITGLSLGALILIARLFYLYLADPARFPISTVKITASYQHITHKQLASILEPYFNASFFTLPVAKLYMDLVALSWADKVQIERVWPDTLKISLTEKIPIATWNQGLMTEEGEVFNEGNKLAASSLPHLRGPKNQQKEVLQVYEKMSKILSIYGLHASALDWRDNQAWDLTLANGLRLHLGKRDLKLRITRFCKAYPAVFAQKLEQLAIVDLRYPRGMAVQWKKREDNG